MANKLLRGSKAPTPTAPNLEAKIEASVSLPPGVDLPTWRFGPKGESVLCNTAEELHDAEKKGFKDTPAAFKR